MFFIIIFLSLSGLCVFPLKTVLKIPAIVCLKNNLDFMGQFIERYSWLATVLVILFVVVLLVQNFSINSTTMKLMGLEFQLKNTEKNIKIQIKNYLSTKRSVFVFYDEYDNYYDVIDYSGALWFFRNYPLLLLYPMYLNFASSNCLPHLPYIVRFIIFNLLLVPSTNPLL